MYQSSKVSITSYANLTDALTTPPRIPLDLTALQPMASVKKFPQATYTPRIYQMELLHLTTVDKITYPTENDQLPASSSVFLDFPFIGNPNPTIL